MATTVKVGNYQLTLETRGLWITRGEDAGAGAVRPFLTFMLQESGGDPMPFRLVRLYQSAPDHAELHGSVTDRIAFDAVIRPSPNHDAISIDFRVGNASEEMNVRVMTRMTLSGEADPRWLIPGLFYGNNRPVGCQRIYPAYSDTNRDARRLLSNFWAFRSDRAAVPMTSVWTYGAYTWMATDGAFGRTKENPRGVGMTGLYFGSEDGNPSLGIDFPYAEAPLKFSYCHEDKMEKEEIFLLLPQNIPLIASLQIGIDPPDLHAYNKVIRGFYKERSSQHPVKARMAPEWAEHSAHTGLLRWHYDGRIGSIYETVNFDRPIGKRPGPGERSHMHAGWQSGALPAYALLWAGRETKHPESITAGTAIINKFTSQLAPAGTIFPVWTEEHGWSCSYGPDEGTAHARTVAEAILFILRSVALEITHNSSHPQWCDAVMSSLNYAMGSQREDGAFPAYYDLGTGSPKSFDGCAGLSWVAAIAAGAAIFQMPHYKDIALRGGAYYEKFIRNEFVFGSVEDQHLVPTCEDCHWAVIAYILLYEMDRSAKWLNLARKAADLAITWRFAYNVVFSPESTLGRYDIKTRGGDICSVATPLLGSYGLLSYREFLKLAAYTGDDFYLERAEDARAFATQLIAREEGQLNARAGMVVGHVYHTDWLQPKGIVNNHSHAMTAAIVKYAELTRRNLNVSRVTYEASRGSNFEEEVNYEPVPYADMALADGLGMAEIGASFGNIPGVSDRVSVSGMVRRPPEMLAAAPFSAANFADAPVAAGEDLLSGLSSSLGLKPGKAANGPPGGRPVAPPPGQGAGSREGSAGRGPSQFGQGGPPGRPQTGMGHRPATQGGAQDVSRMMTNTLSSALGLGSPSPARHGDSASPPTPGGLSGVVPKIPPKEMPTPGIRPFGAPPPPPGPPGAAPSGPERPPGGSNDEVEIKYKIF